MSTPAESSPPLAPDDPRLSEWLDGRLSAAEAAAVAEAVDRSPELARLVADLRAIKAAAQAAAAASPPPGFADRVMAAVVADRGAGAADASDRLVDAEWRVIEAERIAEERAEAAADLANEVAPARAAERRRWPWLSLVAALAMGLLVAVVLNVPPRGLDEAQVALVTSREAEPMTQNRALREAADREIAAASETKAAFRASPPEVSPPRGAADLRRTAGKAAAPAEAIAPIEIMVRGPEGRANLLERLANLGLVVVPSGREPRGELLEVVGPEEAVAAFLAAPLGDELSSEDSLALGATRARDEQPSAEGLAAPAAAAPLAAGRAPAAVADQAAVADRVAAPPRRILVRVIQLPVTAGEPSQP